MSLAGLRGFYRRVAPAARPNPGAPTPDTAPRPDAGGLLRARLSEKVLGMWLGNRHQTQFPLTINLRRLPPHQLQILADLIAVATLAEPDGGPGPALPPRVVQFDRSAGGNTDFEQAVRAARENPRPLSVLLAAIERENLATTAFATALTVTDQRDLTARLFLEYLAARLRLPSDISRSLAQRHRH